MAQKTADVETGIASDNSIPNEANVDVRAYADDGEYATLFDVTRLDDTTVEVAYRRCEAGISEYDSDEQFNIDADKTTEAFAQELAKADPEEAVNLARDFWN